MLVVSPLIRKSSRQKGVDEMSDSSVWEEEQSVLAISVPEANSILDYVRSRYKGDIPLVGVPAHITLLYPWMPPGRIDETILAELATVFAGYPAFEFTLDLGWFGQEVLLLVPKDPTPFIDITKAIMRKWPEFKYYNGEYSDIEPHVTLAYGNESSLSEVAAEVAKQVPVQACATSICLSVGKPGQMITRKMFLLNKKAKEIYLAGGCFWGTEQYLSSIHGVLHTEVGYANGTTHNPTYEEVCRGNTGYAETVKVCYDPEQISLAFLLSLFYESIDPTAVNRQGADRGNQYRTGIYYTDESDMRIIQDSIRVLQKHFRDKIAIQVQALENYFPAEEYHQSYLNKHPRGYCHIGFDKIEKAKLAREPQSRV